jgi:hypothetical protein
VTVACVPYDDREPPPPQIIAENVLRMWERLRALPPRPTVPLAEWVADRTAGPLGALLPRDDPPPTEPKEQP